MANKTNNKKTTSLGGNNAKDKQQLNKSFDFAFEKINYIWMIVGIVLLFLGYLLLIGGGSKDASQFSYALFNAQRLIIAPILMVLGIAVEIYAILLKPKKKKDIEQ
ncbi:MAG: DUF3098 domain-containing protein [Bacteroidales bacterium]|jgi:hypothetical protein|nr:DUF3098 domain-containing protein [Bacteroidales bacterium]